MSESWDAHLKHRLAIWREQNLSRHLKTVAGSGVRFDFNGRQILSFATNDYLGLSNHPQVIAAAKAALDASGAGSRASPLIIGHRREHSELERALAVFKQSDSALVFPSGYQAAVAALGALAGEDESIILDKLAHASLLDGAKLSGARVRVFKHHDVEDLKRILDAEVAHESHHSRPSPRAPLPRGERGEQQRRRCIVVIESLYSMDGDLAPLEKILEITEAVGALLLVDEAHATGIFGARGRGALEEITAAPGLPKNVIAMGTLSKALGSQGGFVCCSSAIAETIVHAGRAYLFSTALAPASAAAAQAALSLIDSEPQRRATVMKRSELLREKLAAMGFTLVASAGPIIAVIAGDEKRALAWSEILFGKGIYAPAIRFPTVKKGQARLRISLSAEHSESDCVALLAAMSSLKSQGC
jgi:8-amino-7-oxononanoate synthase